MERLKEGDAVGMDGLRYLLVAPTAWPGVHRGTLLIGAHENMEGLDVFKSSRPDALHPRALKE